MDLVFLAWKEYYRFYRREREIEGVGKEKKERREGEGGGGMKGRRMGGREGKENDLIFVLEPMVSLK